VAIAAEATFVARSIDTNIQHLTETLTRASQHRGTSFVEVYQNGNVFNDGAWDYAKGKGCEGRQRRRIAPTANRWCSRRARNSVERISLLKSCRWTK
jgi:pyruvate/2-oxoacid:ferredoxin oxidoreductase beta subunit